MDQSSGTNKVSDDSKANSTSNNSNANDVNQTLQTPIFPVAPKLKEQASFSDKTRPFPYRVNDSAQGKTDYIESDKIAKAEGDEYWESYAREIELEKQILEMGGIEKIEAGEVKVPEDVAREMGIEPINNLQSTINNTQGGFLVGGVSLDDSQLSAGLTKPTSSGLRWLVEWFIFQLLKAHFHIRRIKGKILREDPPNKN